MKKLSIKRLFCLLMVVGTVMTTGAGDGLLTAEALQTSETTSSETSVRSTTDEASAVKVSYSAGASLILGMDIALDSETIAALVSQNTKTTEYEASGEEADYSLVMAKVKNYCNMRETPESEGTVVGRLYNSCGGTILDKVEGWTKVRSGDVIGWVSDEYLYFEEEALVFAAEVATEIVVSDTQLWVRATATDNAEIVGVLSTGESAVFVMEVDNWTCIEYGDGVAYVLSAYVHKDYEIDTGETIEAIREREAQEEYARLNKSKDPYDATEEEIDLLAALVQKEAGGESFEGKIAVVNVVLNRVRSSKFPNNIHDVVYAPNQFTPATNGALDKLLAAGGANEECYEAVYAALAGRCTVGDYLYFRRKGNKSGYILGNHVFY